MTGKIYNDDAFLDVNYGVITYQGKTYCCLHYPRVVCNMGWFQGCRTDVRYGQKYVEEWFSLARGADGKVYRFVWRMTKIKEIKGGEPTRVDVSCGQDVYDVYPVSDAGFGEEGEVK